MNRERLAKMVELLDGIQEDIDNDFLKPEQFAMQVWVAEAECGTAGCAVGWACRDRWFNEQGLTLGITNLPEYGDLSHWSAVAAFFDLDMFDATVLFGSEAYQFARPYTVATRIRYYLSTKP